MNSLQLAGLIGFNLLLLMLAVLAFRLIGSGRDRHAGSNLRRSAARPDEMFSFDSWSGSSRSPRPMTKTSRTDRDGR